MYLIIRFCRAIAVGIIAVGSKAAVIAKSAGGAGGLVKGAGALLAAGLQPLVSLSHKDLLQRIDNISIVVRGTDEKIDCRWSCCCRWQLNECKEGQTVTKKVSTQQIRS